MGYMELTNENVENTWEYTRILTEDCFPRLTGTPGCIAAAEVIKESLKEYCDNVRIEQFEHRPNGFLKFMPITASLHFIALFLFFIEFYLIAVFFFTLNVTIYLSQLFFYKGYFDFIFRKEIGTNIIGIIEPQEEVKQQVILSGHYDAPYVFTLLDKNPKLYPVIFGISLFTLIFAFLTSWIVFIFDLDGSTFLLLKLFLGLVSITILYHFIFTTNKISPGAGDNAIAVGLILEMGKIFSKEKLQHTRLKIVALDAEEAGLNGARAYIRSNLEKLKSTPTYNFNIDSIYNKKYLTIFIKDLNSLVELNENEGKLVSDLSEKLGFRLPTSAMPLGGGSTDSAEFGKEKINSVAIVGIDMDHVGQDTAYHSSKDDMSALSKDSIEFMQKLIYEYVIYKDSQV